MHVAFGPEPITEGGRRCSWRRCSHSTNLLGFVCVCVVSFFAPSLIISTHFSVSLYSRQPLDHFPPVTSASVFSLDIYYSSLCPQHLLTLSLSRWYVICILLHQGSLPSPHLILTAICHMGPCLTWTIFSHGSQDIPCSLPPSVWLLLLLALNSKWCLRPWFLRLSSPPHPTSSNAITSPKVLVAQACLTHDPVDCSLPGSSVLGILQVRILKWIAIPFSRGSSWPGY